MRGLFFVYFRCLFFAKEFDPAHKNPEKRSQKSLYLKGKSKISSKETKALFQKKKGKKSESGRRVWRPAERAWEDDGVKSPG